MTYLSYWDVLNFEVLILLVFLKIRGESIKVRIPFEEIGIFLQQLLFFVRINDSIICIGDFQSLPKCLFFQKTLETQPVDKLYYRLHILLN